MSATAGRFTPLPFDTVGMDPAEVLKRVFGHDAFRSLQEDAIRQVVSGGDAIVVLPTSTGKTIIYTIPALCRPGVAIVISPLISLMKDQVDSLRSKGIEARALNSAVPRDEIDAAMRELKDGRLKLLFMSPERLMAPGMLERLGEHHVSLTALDESHTAVQWGPDFRPEYMDLHRLAAAFPDAPHLALTATADRQMRADLRAILKMEHAPEYVASFDRPNISLSIVERRGNGDGQLIDFLRDHEGESGIVYCLSRKKVEETAQTLKEAGFDAFPYHAQLPEAVKLANQDAFRNGSGVIIVATIAFGMGIDKPDVRFVAHVDLSASTDHYMQEFGRAGRDGAPAVAWMAYGTSDIVQRRRMIDEADAAEEFKAKRRAKLSALIEVCETPGCRRQALLATFGERHPGSCGNCDTCLSPATTYDGSEAARKLLSAVLRTGQRFGESHVIDVLIGRRTAKVMSQGHNKLALFGVGAGGTEAAWRSVVRQMVAQGHLYVDRDGYNALKPTPSSRSVLDGRCRPTFVARAVEDARKRRPARDRAAAVAAAADVPQDLLRALKDERRRIAEEQGMPPFYVFSDATLVAIARDRPRDLQAMERIDGIGPHKLRHYAPTFLAIVAIANKARNDVGQA